MRPLRIIPAAETTGRPSSRIRLWHDESFPAGPVGTIDSIVAKRGLRTVSCAEAKRRPRSGGLQGKRSDV
ncbi:hypothetical protein [Geobacillus genomosp. 3]|uniref:hypothetical protein n=1 Tax=Geobacillus genomosp. 3 TaxID=1921421 RepID=UPI000416AE16|nr:hypothetical protein [Geobacillus genomosp. 3]